MYKSLGEEQRQAAERGRDPMSVDKQKEKTMDKRPVVVTTEFRGVFFGYVENDSEAPAKIELSDSRMCVYWSQQTRGVLGLAAQGPNSDSRVGPKVPKITLWKITGIFDCTPEAAEKWELGRWK